MRVYPSAVSVHAVVAWLGARQPGRAFILLLSTGAGLSTVCWRLTQESSLVPAPRTFLVLFALAWMAMRRLSLTDA